MNKERIAIYPGSFDPITYGHIDVIERASQLFDKVIVLMAVNSKKITLFSQAERCMMATESLAHLKNVEVDFDPGLIVEYAQKVQAIAIIRGVRAVTDFEYEFQLALMNRKLNPEVHTLFLMPHESFTYLNSSIVRELGKYKKDASEFVPKCVNDLLKSKFE